MGKEAVGKIAIEKQLGISVKNWRTRLGLPQNALGISVLTLFSDVNSKAPTEALHADELAEILLVEDDHDDVLLVTEALKKANITNRIFVVRDGAAALD